MFQYKNDCVAVCQNVSLHPLSFGGFIGIQDYSIKKNFFKPSDYIWERLIRNIYRGTVVGSRGFDTGIWFAHPHPQYEKHPYLQTYEFLVRKTHEASVHSSVI